MIDLNSETWRTVTKHAEDRLRSLRDRLEASGTDQPTTERYRGAIRELRDVLGLAEEKPEIR